MGDKKTAFVLMPSTSEFAVVYEDLIIPAFEEAGFVVERALDISSQQSILRDIVTAIEKAAVVVADLTEANANVYYELGLAHALGKQVFLISQDVDGAPFDLRSYRIFDYGTGYRQLNEARTRLTDSARRVAAEELRFGSPVLDFANFAKPAALPAEPKEEKHAQNVSEAGLIDLLITIQEGCEEGKEILVAAIKCIEGIGNEARQAAPEVTALIEEKSFRGLRSKLRLVGGKYEKHADDLHSLNRRFRQNWSDTASALEAVIVHPTVPQEERQKVLKVASVLAKSAKVARENNEKLTKTMDEMPSMERTFDSSKRRLVGELNDFTSSMQVVESLRGRLAGMRKRVEVTQEQTDINPALRKHLRECSICGGRLIEDWNVAEDQLYVRLVDRAHQYCEECERESVGWSVAALSE